MPPYAVGGPSSFRRVICRVRWKKKGPILLEKSAGLRVLSLCPADFSFSLAVMIFLPRTHLFRDLPFYYTLRADICQTLSWLCHDTFMNGASAANRRQER